MWDFDEKFVIFFVEKKLQTFYCQMISLPSQSMSNGKSDVKISSRLFSSFREKQMAITWLWFTRLLLKPFSSSVLSAMPFQVSSYRSILYRSELHVMVMHLHSKHVSSLWDAAECLRASGHVGSRTEKARSPSMMRCSSHDLPTLLGPKFNKIAFNLEYTRFLVWKQKNGFRSACEIFSGSKYVFQKFNGSKKKYIFRLLINGWKD